MQDFVHPDQQEEYEAGLKEMLITLITIIVLESVRSLTKKLPKKPGGIMANPSAPSIGNISHLDLDLFAPPRPLPGVARIDYDIENNGMLTLLVRKLLGIGSKKRR